MRAEKARRAGSQSAMRPLSKYTRVTKSSLLSASSPPRRQCRWRVARPPCPSSPSPYRPGGPAPSRSRTHSQCKSPPGAPRRRCDLRLLPCSPTWLVGLSPLSFDFFCPHPYRRRWPSSGSGMSMSVVGLELSSEESWVLASMGVFYLNVAFLVLNLKLHMCERAGGGCICLLHSN